MEKLTPKWQTNLPLQLRWLPCHNVHDPGQLTPVDPSKIPTQNDINSFFDPRPREQDKAKIAATPLPPGCIVLDYNPTASRTPQPPTPSPIATPTPTVISTPTASSNKTKRRKFTIFATGSTDEEGSGSEDDESGSENNESESGCEDDESWFNLFVLLKTHVRTVFDRALSVLNVP